MMSQVLSQHQLAVISVMQSRNTPMYVDLFEYCISCHTFAIAADEQIRGEVNNILAKIAGMVQNLYARAKGGSKREELNSKMRRFHMFEGQTETEAIRDELNWRSGSRVIRILNQRVNSYLKKCMQPLKRRNKVCPIFSQRMKNF